jgi:hypothetical protein
MTATHTIDGLSRELDPRRWVVLAVLCLALLVVGIDGTIVNVALPTLARELHASSSELQWIVDAYTIVFASLLLFGGNTGDRLGRNPCRVLGALITEAAADPALADALRHRVVGPAARSSRTVSARTPTHSPCRSTTRSTSSRAPSTNARCSRTHPTTRRSSRPASAPCWLVRAARDCQELCVTGVI